MSKILKILLTAGVFLLVVVLSASWSALAQDGTTAQTAPLSLAIDAKDNLIVGYQGRVQKVTPDGQFSVIAGTGACGFGGDGGPGTAAQVCNVSGLAVASDGSILISDHNNNRIRQIDPSGMISTFAGTGSEGFSGDGGPAKQAQLWPQGLAVDSAGNVFIADVWNHRIRKIDPAGVISTFAGKGPVPTGINPRPPRFSGDGGPATSAQLYAPTSVAVDGNGNVFIGDSANRRVRKVTKEGVISTVAGGGENYFSATIDIGDFGPAIAAKLDGIQGLALDAMGNVFVAGGRVRKVTTDGRITTIAGTPSPSRPGTPPTVRPTGNPAVATNVVLGAVYGIAVDSKGNVFLAEVGGVGAIRKITADGQIWIIAERP